MFTCLETTCQVGHVGIRMACPFADMLIARQSIPDYKNDLA
jgi:hypothetical protein